jgi:XRE family aerobic/anaerobic benzoate catabolism transcriptional regulator
MNKPDIADGMKQKSMEEEVADLSLRLGRRVRSARGARAMTMKQLAEESGISLPYLSKVEKGDGNISIGVLYRLATALNMPMETLLSDNERYGADYALILEFLKRRSPQELGEIRQKLVENRSGTASAANEPRRIALIGLRGAGKSTLGALLAKELRIPFVELNREIEAEAGVSLNEIFWIYGQTGYRRLERRCLERIIASYPEVVLATGGGIVVEPATCELLLHSFFNIWLRAAPEIHFQRVMEQHDARIASPQLRQEAMENIVQTLEARESLYGLAPAQIDTSDKTVEQALQAVMQLLPPNMHPTRKAAA